MVAIVLCADHAMAWQMPAIVKLITADGAGSDLSPRLQQHRQITPSIRPTLSLRRRASLGSGQVDLL